MERRAEIPALTGLRFVAATTIVLSHFSQGSGAPLLGLPNTLSALGMPLFFTLSGFIVHYVYAASFAKGWRSAVPDFALARFSRLYPLFFALLLLYLPGRLGRDFYAHPEIGLSYVSLTGSWWYWIIDGHAITQERYGVSWSISTEVFFYLVYALGLFNIARIESIRRCTAALAILCVLTYALLFAVFATQGVWEPFILARHPDFIASATDVDNSFVRWLLYISPYVHLPEFIAGCLACQLFLLLRRTGTAASDRIAEPLSWIGVTYMIAALVALYGAWYGGYGGAFLDFINFLHRNFLVAPACCLLLLSLALGGSSIGRVLAHPFPKYLGEISYSIYLGHSFVLSFMFLVGLTQPLYVMTLGLVLVVAAASLLYFAIERPAKAWLRATVSGARRLSSLRYVR